MKVNLFVSSLALSKIRKYSLKQYTHGLPELFEEQFRFIVFSLSSGITIYKIDGRMTVSFEMDFSEFVDNFRTVDIATT